MKIKHSKCIHTEECDLNVKVSTSQVDRETGHKRCNLNFMIDDW